MALSEIQRADVTRRLNAFCEARAPAEVRNKVRLGFRITGADVVLFEQRPGFQRPDEWHEGVIAKFRYVGTQKLWRLYCQHRDMRWHSYEALPAAGSFSKLLDEVAVDPNGSFWG